MSNQRTVRDVLVAVLRELALATSALYLLLAWLDTVIEGWATLFTSVTAWLVVAIAAATLAQGLTRSSGGAAARNRLQDFVWPVVSAGVTALLLTTSFWQDRLPEAVVWTSALAVGLVTWVVLRRPLSPAAHA